MTSPAQTSPLTAMPPEEASQLMELVEAERLLRWRRQQHGLGGQPQDFDWLLDLGGGLDWQQLQRLLLDPCGAILLQRSRADLAALWRRHLHDATPLQYLLGCCPWRNLQLKVAEAALIPRPETELLPDLGLALLDGLATTPGVWADLGTGSGCLAVALALALPSWRGWAVDCSGAALALAAANLRTAGVAERVSLGSGDWWDALPATCPPLALVLANPPYIPTQELARLEPLVRCHEPHLALDGGVDGLHGVRAILQNALGFLAPGGALAMEHGAGQSKVVAALFRAAGLEAVTRHHDLEGKARFVSGRRPGRRCPIGR